MSRRLSTAIWLLLLATATFGLGGAYMRHLIEPADPFSAWNHPWQATFEKGHAVLGPLFAILLGFTIGGHGQLQLALGKRKRSGQVLVAIAICLCLSGGVLSAFGAPDSPIFAWIHGIFGSSFVLLFVFHVRAMRREAKA